ncbi:MAG: sigma-70 family RNA polymerase sigma factor [Oligoflexia bacterium]|nr:sigma-70 family RNA polymerase sigma factor [Oligoflexia bacterium]
MAAPALRLHDAQNDEARWIDAARDGDPQAVAWLAERYTHTVYRFALRMMRNEQDAHDAAQETMVKVLRNLQRYDKRWRFQTWVLSIARNTCIDEFRRRKRKSYKEAPDIADDSPGPMELTSRRERASSLHTAMGDIPPMYREVLVLYHFEHLKYREIADLLDLPIGTVMNRIFRARKKLRTAYQVVTGDAAPAGAT